MHASKVAALAVKAVLRPDSLVRAFAARSGIGSFTFRLAIDGFRRPHYAYGVYHAASLAHRLGLPAITVAEFGVATGNGLVELEQMAREVEAVLPTRIHVVGFDTGFGMPQHTDYRDLPYIWQRGQFRMDVDAVQRRLSKAKLVLGPVSDTVPTFLSSSAGTPPLGFIAFDLDYYSSTIDAFRIFDGPHSMYLPRVLCYFDDIVGDDEHLLCEDVGELLAIREFNDAREDRIRPIYGLASKRLFASPWAVHMFAYHRFDHPRYNDHIIR